MFKGVSAGAWVFQQWIYMEEIVKTMSRSSALLPMEGLSLVEGRREGYDRWIDYSTFLRQILLSQTDPGAITPIPPGFQTPQARVPATLHDKVKYT